MSSTCMGYNIMKIR